MSHARPRDETIKANAWTHQGRMDGCYALFISIIRRERDVGQVASSTDEGSSAGSPWSYDH